MSLYSYKEFSPIIPSTAFIAPSADVIGRVTLGEHASVWHQCVVRGDINSISIGNNTNIQDLSILHVTYAGKLTIGSQVTVGHAVTLHACTVEDHCLIGMGAVILDGAHIGHHSVVAGGSVVPPGKVYPPHSMIVGNPAVVKRPLRPDEVTMYGEHYRSYVQSKNEFLDNSIVKLIKI